MDTSKAYCRGLRKIPRLSPEATLTASPDVLVRSNLRLVVKLAHKFRQPWTDIADLIQEGNCGLIAAARQFDPTKSPRFSNYAAFFIRGYLMNYLSEHARTVRLSRGRAGRRVATHLRRAQDLGQPVTAESLAARLDLDSTKVAELMALMEQPELHLEAPTAADGTLLIDMLPSTVPSAEALLSAHEWSAEVSAVLAAFGATLVNPRERAIWERHLLADVPTSLSALARDFGVTKQRMSQLATDLKRRLRHHLTEVRPSFAGGA